MNEAMIRIILKQFGLNPEEIIGTIGQFGQIAVDLKVQLDRIETKIDELNSRGLLKLPNKETENAEH